MTDARHPDRVWWTPDQIAEAGLPDMPGTPRRINAMASRFNWRAAPGKASRRSGKGGGWEYHCTLFPMRAQQALLAAVKEAKPLVQQPRGEAWERFEALPESARKTAERRLLILQKTEALERGGVGRDLAVREVAEIEGVSARTIWNWRYLVEGVSLSVT